VRGWRHGRSQDQRDRGSYFVCTRWKSDEAFQAWLHGDAGMRAHAGERAKPVGTGSALLEFEIVQESTPRRES
jgi:heme oxygenase (mycobilin-producing)